MATIGYSYWGYLNPQALGPDGGKYIRWQLLNRLVTLGHTVICLQKQRDTVFQPFLQVLAEKLTWTNNLPDIDLLICEHRWPMFPNQRDVKRQDELLTYYEQQGVPCVLWDQDHEVKAAYEERFPHAILVEPSEYPNHYTRQRYTWHYAADAPGIVKAHVSPSQTLAYVGNNYGRDAQFARYVGEVAAHIPGEVHVYGNWRRRPKRNKYALDPTSPVVFHETIPQAEVHDVYHDALATILITKRSYAKTGLMAIRLLEAVHAGTIVLGPSETRGLEHFILTENIVTTTRDVYDRLRQLRNLGYDERQELIDAQLAKLQNLTTLKAVQRLDEIIHQATGRTLNLVG